jgi:hypothetical protein
LETAELGYRLGPLMKRAIMGRLGALKLTAVGETATGVALLVAPSLVGRLLFGEDLEGTAVLVARVAGIALIGLGIACWPGPPLLGMFIYGAAVTLYLAYLGVIGAASGVLLWPVVVLHAVLTALMIAEFFRGNP